jgi:streptogramin lyase
MTSMKQNINVAAVAGAVALATALWSAPTLAADAILSGQVKRPDGKPLEGVTISAKAQGSSITTSVFTDMDGYYYLPALPGGQYRLRAQAVIFGTQTAIVDANGKKNQDFALAPLTDFVRQLSGADLLAAMPQDTPEDAAMHRILRSQCVACHSASYVLQHRFDEDGWSKILTLMKGVNVYGMKVERPVQAVIDLNQKQLAAYLARARGPGESSMKFDKLRPRPTGETARVVFREYDVPINPEAGLPDKTTTNDGSEWSLGTPSGIGSTVHDAWLDLDGNVWHTSNVPNHVASIEKIDTATGKITPFKLNGPGGFAAPTHGMTRDPKGMIWFNVNTGKGGLGRIDPKTQKINVFLPPDGMMPTGGATTVDYDGKGMIWSSAPEGALRFDPTVEKFTEFRSKTFKTPNGNGVTYGTAADRDGNGWWAEMALDIIGKGDGATGAVSELKLAPIKEEMDRISPAAMAVYEKAVAPDFNSPFPWQQGPRRMGTDKNDDVLWVGNSWGGNLARVNTKTNEITYVPLPDPKSNLPYHVNVDSKHNAWTNLWMTDQVARLNPATKAWTLFDLPTRGGEARYVSTLETSKGLQVVLPYFRANKVAVMSFRSESEMQAAKAAAN